MFWEFCHSPSTNTSLTCRKICTYKIWNVDIFRSIRSEATEEEMIVVRKLAAHILGKIQQHLIVLPNMIVASLLLQNSTGIDLGTVLSKMDLYTVSWITYF